MNAIIGKKVGMSQIFTEAGVAVPVTVVDVSGNVISKKLESNGGVTHIEIGKDVEKNSTKADKGNYKLLQFVPKFKKVFKVSQDVPLNVGDSLLISNVLNEGDKVSVTSVTKGKGFQGVVKRWRFAGGPRTHGASDRERAPGSIGSRTIPGRVFKGKKMAGHMGVKNKTIQGLKVVKILNDKNLIAIKGAISGPAKGYVIIKKEN